MDTTDDDAGPNLPLNEQKEEPLAALTTVLSRPFAEEVEEEGLSQDLTEEVTTSGDPPPFSTKRSISTTEHSPEQTSKSFEYVTSGTSLSRELSGAANTVVLTTQDAAGSGDDVSTSAHHKWFTHQQWFTTEGHSSVSKAPAPLDLLAGPLKYTRTLYTTSTQLPGDTPTITAAPNHGLSSNYITDNYSGRETEEAPAKRLELTTKEVEQLQSDDHPDKSKSLQAAHGQISTQEPPPDVTPTHDVVQISTLGRGVGSQLDQATPTHKVTDSISSSSIHYSRALYALPALLLITFIIIMLLLVCKCHRRLAKRRQKSWYGHKDVRTRPLSDILKRQWEIPDAAAVQLLAKDNFPSPKSMGRPSFSYDDTLSSTTSPKPRPRNTSIRTEPTQMDVEALRSGHLTTHMCSAFFPQTSPYSDDAVERHPSMCSNLAVYEPHSVNRDRTDAQTVDDHSIPADSCNYSLAPVVLDQVSNQPLNLDVARVRVREDQSTTGLHEYDPVYVPRSCAAAMNRLVDNSMYVRRPTFLQNLTNEDQTQTGSCSERNPSSLCQPYASHRPPVFVKSYKNAMGATASGERPRFRESMGLPSRTSVASTRSSHTYDEIRSSPQSERNSFDVDLDVCVPPPSTPENHSNSQLHDEEQMYAPVAFPERPETPVPPHNNTNNSNVSGIHEHPEESVFSFVSYPYSQAHENSSRPTSGDAVYETIQFP